MPEMTFDVRWPNGTVQSCYSPSLVIHDHLRTGVDYSIDDFLVRVTAALTIASDRVRAKFGFSCTSAMQTLDSLQETAAQQGTTPGPIRVVSMTPPTIAAAVPGGKS